jgi:lipopolysaccharide transport system permease protein
VHRPRGLFSVGVLELWRYRRVIRYLGWVCVVRKFRGMWLGMLWIPLRPALDLFARALVFGGFLQVGSGDRPYFIFLTVGLASWMIFDRTAYWGFRGLQLHLRLLRRTRIPWLTSIVSATIPAVADASLYASVGACVAIYYKVTQGTSYVAINSTTSASLLGIVLVALYGITFSLWAGPLVLKIPDLRFVLRYILTFWLFVTPVLYVPSKLPERYQRVFELNPLTAPIELIKYGLLGTGAPSGQSLASTFIVLAVALPLGLVYLRKNEQASQMRL